MHADEEIVIMTTRHEYIEKLKNKLDEWDTDIDALESDIARARADLKFELKDQMAAVRLRRDNARLKLRELADASDDAWKDLMDGADEAWDSIREALEKARSHFSRPG
jgi:hypothetical protein